MKTKPMSAWQRYRAEKKAEEDREAAEFEARQKA